MHKRLKRSLREFFGLIFLRIFVAINFRLPLEINYLLGKIFGSIAYWVAYKHRQVAIQNLNIAFPKLSIDKKKKIVKKFFIFMVESSFELIYFLKNKEALENIKIENIHYLDEALSQKKGVILLTAHLGNFALLSLKLASLGYPINFVTRPMRDERIGQYLYDLRTKANIKSIFSYPRQQCVTNIIKALRSNQIVIMQMDQNFGTGGVWVDFFGKLAATPTGPVTLALRTKALLVPAYIIRTAIGKHTIKIFPAQQLTISDDKEKTVIVNVEKFTKMIESWIKESIYQWSWIHNRWKSQPAKF